MARCDAAVGRYIYLPIDGIEYRMYFEETGTGIPLLLQHTPEPMDGSGVTCSKIQICSSTFV